MGCLKPPFVVISFAAGSTNTAGARVCFGAEDVTRDVDLDGMCSSVCVSVCLNTCLVCVAVWVCVCESVYWHGKGVCQCVPVRVCICK